LGKTNEDRKLFLVFTTRNSLIRVISARNMNKKERTAYDDEKKIPHFKNEDEEREFWAANDSTEYVDWNKASVAVFPKLKPSTKTISLRVPVQLLNNLKMLANEKDVPYQSLIKMLLSEKVKEYKNSRL